MELLLRARGEFWGRSEASASVSICEFRRLWATAPEQEVSRHVHEAAHFIFVPNGGYISTADGAPDLSSLPLVVFNPVETAHRDRFLHGRGAFLTLTIEGSLSGLLATGRPRVLNDLSAISAARRAERILATGRSDRLALEGALLALISAVSNGPSAHAAPLWLSTAYEMIWTGGAPSVAAVAAEVGVHPVHLARVFVDHLGCAPGEILRGRRLERAARALGRSTAALAEIASDLGFADQSHLTRGFSRTFGMTPAQFRRSRNVAWVQDSGAAAH